MRGNGTLFNKILWGIFFFELDRSIETLLLDLLYTTSTEYDFRRNRKGLQPKAF